MLSYLNKIREPVSTPLFKKLLFSFLILLLGIALGFISKALDETAVNALSLFIQKLDLANFLSRMGFWIFGGVWISIYSKTPIRAAINTFLFFVGMVSSYYLYTIFIAGFFPRSYMMIWITVTAVSPLLGAICWYAKGTHIISMGISSVIIMIMARQAFNFGFWYFDIAYPLEFILLFATIAILYKSPKQILIVTVAGIALRLITSQLNLFWGMM